MNPEVQPKARRDLPFLFCVALALITLLFSISFTLLFAAQPLLDLHSFRQTQTALTSYWFLRDGFRLAYETPVGGYPWAIPFEFPLFQALAAALAWLLRAPLDPTGRLLSYAFTLACLVPIRSVIRQLALPPLTWWTFVALYLSSPIYLYWGRAFMMETAALFCCLAALPFFIRMLRQGDSRPRIIFSVFISLALLQKVTTALPVLLLLGGVYIWHVVQQDGLRGLLRHNTVATLVTCFAGPLCIGAAWVGYTDWVKTANPLGISLTSQALTKWNWGTLEQRTSTALFGDVLWDRLIADNLGGVVGVLLLVLALSLPRVRQLASYRFAILFCLLAGVLPVFLFTNLHIVHRYYQTANAIWLMMGLAMAMACIAARAAAWAWLMAPVLLLIVASNLFAFANGYARLASSTFNVHNSRVLAVAAVLREELAEGDSFVAFGDDWSSAFAYYAQHKSFTVPNWFQRSQELLSEPERFLGDAPLGAIVACQPGGNGVLAGVTKLALSRNWDLAYAYGCFIAVPDRAPGETLPRTDNARCEGEGQLTLDPKVDGADDMLTHTLYLHGWTAAGVSVEDVFVSIADGKQPAILRHAIRAPRQDVKQNDRDWPREVAYSLIFDTRGLAGRYIVSVLRQVGGSLEQCQWRSEVTIDGEGSH